MKNIHKRTLVLNVNFLPLGIISWRRAIVLSIINEEDSKRGVEVVEYYEDDHIKGVNNKTYPIPAIVRVAKFINKHKNTLPFSRKNIFIRDRMICQYCNKRFKPQDLTYDHVIPKAKWKRQKHKNGPTIWENIVTSCIRCNRKKANRTPQEANMSLLRQPKPPNPNGFILGLSPWTIIPDQWRLYLTPIYKDIFNA